jgi:hypothetical protein
MKKLMIAAVLAATCATTANADMFGLSPYVGLEREYDAKVNNLYAGVSKELPWGILASGQVNMHDTTGGVDLSLEGADINLSKALNDSMKIYANTDLSSKWKRTETTIGIKISF